VSEWYWSVDIPGLTQQGAERVVSLCRDAAIGEVGCIAVDPRSWFMMHLDRTSVEVMASALQGTKNSRVADGLRELMEEWLKWQEEAGELY
jgi:hypothetical protein